MNIKDRGSKRGSTLKKEVHKLLKFKDLQILFFYFCGETGIRTPDTLLGYTRFPGVPLQPLEHLSFSGDTILSFLKSGANYKENRELQAISATNVFFFFVLRRISPANI